MKYLMGLSLVVFLSFFWYGWGRNVVALYQDSGGMEKGQIIIRSVGIPILPIGAVLGYIGE